MESFDGCAFVETISLFVNAHRDAVSIFFAGPLAQAVGELISFYEREKQPQGGNDEHSRRD